MSAPTPEQCKALRAFRASRGVCVRCGEWPVEKFRNCVRCRTKVARAMRKRHQAKRRAYGAAWALDGRRWTVIQDQNQGAA